MIENSNKNKQLKKLKPITLQKKKHRHLKTNELKVKVKKKKAKIPSLKHSNPQDVSEQKRVTLQKTALIKAMVAAKGLVTYACEAVGCTRKTYYEYYKRDNDFKEAIDDIKEIVLDFSESKLHELLEDKEPSAVYFHLKCQGKSRGYFEKQQIGFDPDQPLQTIVLGGKELGF
jgi:hypothetical protein